MQSRRTKLKPILLLLASSVAGRTHPSVKAQQNKLLGMLTVAHFHTIILPAIILPMEFQVYFKAALKTVNREACAIPSVAQQVW